MSSAESLFKSFIVLIVCLLSSVIITNYILMPAELVIKEVQKTGISDVPLEWQSSGDANFYLTLGYFLTYFLSVFAVGQFVWTAIRKQKYDIYGNPLEEEVF